MSNFLCVLHTVKLSFLFYSKVQVYVCDPIHLLVLCKIFLIILHVVPHLPLFQHFVEGVHSFLYS